MTGIRRFFGDRRFYRAVLTVALPIMVQNGITNFVSLLDNVMVGRLGTEQMSGVTIVNQFIFVFNLLIFGAVSSAGIFTAQYHGRGDTDGIRATFRFKLLIVLASSALCIAVFAVFDAELISWFLHEGSAEGNLALTLEEGKKYLFVMLFGLVPYAISQAYASTLRETGETLLPMLSGLLAVCVNLFLNWVLIFGNLGSPVLGVSGAAIATVISRYVELAVTVIWSHTHAEKCPFTVGAYRSLYIPRTLVWQITYRGLPLMLNEVFWAFSVTFTNQCYSMRGIDVVAALNIVSTITNVFSVVYISLGSAISIMVGNLLGSGKLKEAKETDGKMIFFSILCSAGIGIVLIACSSLFPLMYNISAEARRLAAYMITVAAAIMPMSALANSAYFTLRSGGRVLVTILFDSVYMWAIVVPLAYCLSRFTSADIRLMYLCCQSLEVIKGVFGLILVRKGDWVRQLVDDGQSCEEVTAEV